MRLKRGFQTMDKKEQKMSARMSLFRTATVLLFSLALSWLFVMSAQAESQPQVRMLASPKEIKVEGLVDHHGESFEFSQLEGRVAFVMFGFTNCPDICPMTLQRLRSLEASLDGAISDAAFVMISVDGQRDSVDVMKDYLADFSTRFIGVTGESGVVSAAAVQFQAAYFKGISSVGDDRYVVAHSPQIFLLDPSGRLRGEFHDAPIEMMQSVSLAVAHEPENLHASNSR